MKSIYNQIKKIEMNEEIKEGLKNAGLKKFSNEETKMNLITGEFQNQRGVISVIVDSSKQTVTIHKECKVCFVDVPFQDLEELNKICYGYLLKDLDFEKKEYAWENCITKKGFFVNSWGKIIEQLARDYERGQDRNVCCTEAQALSILSTSQLFQIVAAINYDFEREESDCLIYPIFTIKGELSWIRSQNKMNPFGLNSVAACEELIRTNTPLLHQYFETK